MSRWPDDPTAYRPSARWLGVVVVGLVLVVFATDERLWPGHDALAGPVSVVCEMRPSTAEGCDPGATRTEMRQAS